MITPKQIELVQQTWAKITPVSQKMGEEFYVQLFKNHPELRPMFKTDPKDQAMKLMFMLSYMVHRLDQIRDLQEEIVKLATRHKGYGAEIKHYAFIGETLLWSLEQNLGKQWNKETEEAWTATSKFISDLMIGVHKA